MLDLQLKSDGLPPHNAEVEEVLLGALLLDPQSAYRVKTVQPDWFYCTPHQQVYKAVQRLNGRGQMADMTSVVAELADIGQLDSVGGQSRLAAIAASAISSCNVESYAEILYSKWIRREIVRTSDRLRALAWAEGSEAEVLMKAAGLVAELAKSQTGNWKDLGDLAVSYCHQLRRLLDGEALPSVKTGFIDLDEACPLEYDTLTWLGARPGMGKSAIAAAIALHIAMQGLQVVFISLEMTGEQIMRRWIAANAGVPLKQLKKGQLDTDQLAKVESLMETWVDASRSSNLLFAGPGDVAGKVEAVCAKVLQKAPELIANPGIVIIDHIHCLGTTYDEITKISATIRDQLRGKVRAPILGLAQLSRPQSGATVKPPELTDFRGSGGIEQDGDNALGLHRPAYYDKNSEKQGIMEVHVLKQREGEPNTMVELLFEGQFSRLRNLAKGSF